MQSMYTGLRYVESKLASMQVFSSDFLSRWFLHFRVFNLPGGSKTAKQSYKVDSRHFDPWLIPGLRNPPSKRSEKPVLPWGEFLSKLWGDSLVKKQRTNETTHPTTPQHPAQTPHSDRAQFSQSPVDRSQQYCTA